jgi:hypothetical protein
VEGKASKNPWALQCDSCNRMMGEDGRPRHGPTEEAAWFPSKEDVLKAAAKAGWWIEWIEGGRGGRHYCPECDVGS